MSLPIKLCSLRLFVKIVNSICKDSLDNLVNCIRNSADHDLIQAAMTIESFG
jgi:hypothetical protein